MIFIFVVFISNLFFFFSFFFLFNVTATTEIYTLSLHDALPISGVAVARQRFPAGNVFAGNELFQRGEPVAVIGRAEIGIAGGLGGADLLERSRPFGPSEHTALVKRERHTAGLDCDHLGSARWMRNEMREAHHSSTDVPDVNVRRKPWPHEPGQAQADKLGPQTHVAHPHCLDCLDRLVAAGIEFTVVTVPTDAKPECAIETPVRLSSWRHDGERRFVCMTSRNRANNYVLLAAI